MLASLLLGPAFGKDPPGLKRFKDNHTYTNRNRAFDCTYEMNRKQATQTYCRPCSSVILGNPPTDVTPINNVINICRGEGTAMGDNLYRSNINFRTMVCRLQTPRAVPPNCIYSATPKTGRITVGCSQGNPVHFDGCHSVQDS
uniref:Ribonuclease A-domain domain-containing protein n=1 Tax=Neogobius melanostomus TaxID=47308 RepID=A0A8C6TJR0_9GOBI